MSMIFALFFGALLGFGVYFLAEGQTGVGAFDVGVAGFLLYALLDED